MCILFKDGSLALVFDLGVGWCFKGCHCFVDPKNRSILDFKMTLIPTVGSSSHPRGVNALDKRACAFVGLHGDLEHAVHVDVVAVDEVVAHWLRRRPANEHALVQLPFQRQVLGCWNCGEEQEVCH